MKNNSINKFLFQPRPGNEPPLFKNAITFFQEIVSTEGHMFSATNDDGATKIKLERRFKQRWNQLVQGRRNYHIDKNLEEAFILVLKKKIEAGIKEQTLIEDGIAALRKAALKAKVDRNIPPTQLPLQTSIPFNPIALLKKEVQRSNTVFVLCDEMIVRRLFSSNSFGIQETFWDAIILDQNPNIELNIAYEDNQGIWDILFQELRYFLLYRASERYSIPALKRFFTVPEQQQHEILREVLRQATQSKSSRGPRLSIKIRRHPASFEQPYIVTNPYIGDTEIFSLSVTNALEVEVSDSAREIDCWKKYTLQYFFLTEETKLVKKLVL